jgi:hypothetical protein
LYFVYLVSRLFRKLASPLGKTYHHHYNKWGRLPFTNELNDVKDVQKIITYFIPQKDCNIISVLSVQTWASHHIDTCKEGGKNSCRIFIITWWHDEKHVVSTSLSGIRIGNRRYISRPSSDFQIIRITPKRKHVLFLHLPIIVNFEMT